ncbi:hypothetical protein JCM31826_04630 [Thermaurantimonas aggregans]|uniref:Uncharacterized protein n=1 Tax=Thermaurantimonas aggregans TaxID=2173829 RepID=A0A401XJ22_9FLAO|nr:hypothetical protein [Thermaurantimonas aggregans]MCX8149003.1 hypothetical protein [Thermaurantimonas aggregans]GCD76981.1 hypothetical protein JCM31826_04630 [Thermaurantimonas aggregans]
MVQIKNLIFPIFLVTTTSCATYKGAEVRTIRKIPVLDFYEDVVILNDAERLPKQRTEVGTITIKKSDYHQVPCGWVERLTAATLEARKVGGNVIVLDKISGNINLATNGCGEINGYIYNIEENLISQLKKYRVNGGLKNKYDFARVVFIKPSFATNYSIYVNEENLGLVKGGEIIEYKTKNKEPLIIWAKTESKTQLVLNVEPGYDYFIFCNEIPTGFMLPQVQFVTLQPEVAIDLINKMKR